LVTFLVRIDTLRVGDSETEPTRGDDRVHNIEMPKTLEEPKDAESLDQAMAMMIHDLCGPVARVKAVTELLQSELEAIWSGTDSAHQARNWLGIIDRAAIAIEEQFQVLAEVTRAQSAEPLVPHFERMDLVALVSQVLDEYQASNRRRSLRLESPLESVYGMWDHILIRRAVDNLLGNAVKYTPHGGRVVVSIEQEDEPHTGNWWAVITVQDSGIGIPAADLPHVFEMFQRGSNLSGERGVGVGLASVHEIVSQHGGVVSMTSTEGVGTAVTIRLPMEPDPATQFFSS
jgi:signal transduction histidine kinase